MAPLIQLATNGNLTLNQASMQATVQVVLKFIAASAASSSASAPSASHWGELVQRLQADPTLDKAATEAVPLVEQARLLFAGATTILKTALRQRLPVEQLRNDLVLVLQLPQSLSDLLLAAWKSISSQWAAQTPDMSAGDVPGTVLEHLDRVRASPSSSFTRRACSLRVAVCSRPLLRTLRFPSTLFFTSIALPNRSSRHWSGASTSLSPPLSCSASCFLQSTSR